MGRGGRALVERVWRSILVTVLCSMVGIRRAWPPTIVPWPANATFSALSTWKQKKKKDWSFVFEYWTWIWEMSQCFRYSVISNSKVEDIVSFIKCKILLDWHLSPSLGLHTEWCHHSLWVVPTNHKQPVSGSQEVKDRKVCICSGKSGKQLWPAI